jgi:hypothetical protein
MQASAQMSPFDGSYTVVVKINAKALPAGVHLELQETNPPADSCRFSDKPLRVKFQPPEEVLIKNRNENKHWEDYATEYAKQASFMGPGYYAVVLSMGERTCMTPEGNNYRYTKRTFSIMAVQQNGETTLAQVPADQVYDLGLMRGRWKDIHAVKLDYPKSK